MLDPKQALKFADELVSWYWQHGAQRHGLYALTPNDWLRSLYSAQRRLAQAEMAEANPRVAFALWGPSQSGKSTLLSNFLDQEVWRNLKEGEPVDGTLSALYWPGADPCVFYVNLPQDQFDRAKDVVSMNPFTGGRDASAVLTRFVMGSLEATDGVYHVADPRHPVEVFLLGESQVQLALALGYDSECLGSPKQSWQQREWTQVEFRNVLDDFCLKNRVPEGSPVNREAYEVIHGLCEVIEDLVFSGLRRFQRLRTDGRQADEWLGLLYSLLVQPSLVTSPERARAFVGQLLWDGSPPITQHYQELLRKLQALRKRWGGRRIRCSLKVAAMLLNMDAYDLIERRQQALPGFRETVREDDVLLDLDLAAPPSEPCETVKEFGLFQGLVWEIVLPVNFANLPLTLAGARSGLRPGAAPAPGPAEGVVNSFRQFLEKGDLLDFPGVSNDVAGKSTRIAAWDGIGEEERKHLNEEQTFGSYRFFSKILKRGKTASIVSTYAKRLTIDGFTIFQFLDTNPPANADQILSGVRTWWACLAPEYNPDEVRRSPLPLNLALTWWKPLYDTCQTLWSRGEQYYATKREIVKKLGRVADPGIVWTTFALNYYSIPRGKPADETLPAAYLFDNLNKETELKAQFNTPESFKSIREMLEDRQTGGATYLFEELLSQLRRLTAGGAFNRSRALGEIRTREVGRLDGLSRRQHMFPPPESRDVRREHLLEFEKGLRQATQRKAAAGVVYVPEEEMRKINHALRALLNVDYADLEILPSSNVDIRPEFIQRQYLAWVRKQAARWRLPVQPADPSCLEPDWSLLGLTSQTLVEACLSHLVESILTEQLQAIADWLKQDVRPGNGTAYARAGGAGRRENHLPFLAVRMSNQLAGPAATGEGSDTSDESQPPSYRVFVKPFLEDQLPRLINARVSARALVQVPGTRELRELFQRYDLDVETTKAS